ncbi:hypothetical protein [uncultured Deinococcus sp.]|uniref:hypothetical protein n=1 Tax=uncultured Deinococcus sp. TaxID=158789 RepID=UPI0025F3DB83|nr:hypothetical protein [uncultured Deinococcus sp.]
MKPTQSFAFFACLTLILSGIAFSQEKSPPATTQPCETFDTDIGNDVNQIVSASWREAAVFPDISKTVRREIFSIKCADYQVSYDGQTFFFKAKSFGKSLNVISNIVNKTILLVSSPVNDPNGRSQVGADLECAIDDQIVNSLCGTTRYIPNDKTQSLEYVTREPPYVSISGPRSFDIVIGIRQDGGSLQPVVYEKNAYKFDIDIQKPYEIYIKPYKYVVFEKIRVDPIKHEITMLRKSPFPNK